MPNRYTQPAVRLIEVTHRQAYGRLLDIAMEPTTGPVLQLAATGEAILLAANLAKIRKQILRNTDRKGE